MNKPMPKYLKIFDIRIQELKDGSKKPKVVFNKGIEVTYNGEPVDLGQYSGGFLKKVDEIIAGLEAAGEAGKLKEEYVNDQIGFLQEKSISSVFEVNTQPKK